MEMDVAGAGGDGDVGRTADVEGAVEVAVGEGDCGGEERELAAAVARILMVMEFPLVDSDDCGWILPFWIDFYALALSA